MSTLPNEARPWAERSALIIGVGGLGCPAAAALAQSGIGKLTLADDDRVDESNLHRQILFSDTDVGADKLDAARRALTRLSEGRTEVELVRSRFLPENARTLVRSADVVIEGADNFATKFLAADACTLEGRPVVHGASIRWIFTVWAVAATGRPCYRCLFEDLPGAGAQPNCNDAGVMGPVTGIAGALMADLALRVLAGESVFGQMHSFDGKADVMRKVDVPASADCDLCGPRSSISDIIEARYTKTPLCA